MADEQGSQSPESSGGPDAKAQAESSQAARARRPSRRTVSREQRRRRSESRRNRKRRFYLAGGSVIALALIAGLLVPSLAPTAGAPAVSETQPTPTAFAGTEAEIQPGGESPPTSGPRGAEPADWGFHAEQAPDESVVGSLEAGGIAFNYGAVEESAFAEFRSFVESLPGYPGCYVAHPYSGVADGEATLTAWGWTRTVEIGDTDAMDAFVAAHRNNGPLFIDGACGAGAPDSAAPTPDAATAAPSGESASDDAAPTPEPAS